MAQRALPRKRPTQADVARRAGVSQAVVSAVLNPHSRIVVAEETRVRVLAIIDELGYAPNQAARSLRTRTTLTIANVIPDIANPFYPAFQRGIQDVADQHGYDVITANTDGAPEKERRALRLLRPDRVDGAVVSPFHLDRERLRSVVDAGVALVVFGTLHEEPEAPFDRLYVDNERAAREAVTHLIDQGHTRIAMIAGEEDTPPRSSRLRGYRRALSDRQIPHDELLVRGGGFSQEAGYQAARDLLRLWPRPTAVFAANDLMAIGALMALRDAGVRVPAEMAVVGFDDIPAAAAVSPPLTTVAQFPNRLGGRAAELLIERLSGAAPRDGALVEMPFELVVRASS